MTEKIGYLDSLRGIGALVVLFHHYILAFLPALVIIGSTTHAGYVEQAIRNTPLNVIYNGNFAVCIFFVLSGYVLSHKFFSTGKQEVIVSSAVRRYVRLAVPVIFIVVVAYLLFSAALNQNETVALYTGSSWLAHGSEYDPGLLDMIKHAVWGIFVNNEETYVNVLWTMTIEFLGSFVVFSFVSLFGRMRNRWIFYTGAMLLFFNSYILAFIIGMLMADVYCSASPARFRVKSVPVLAIMFIAGIFLGSYMEGNTWDAPVYRLIGSLIPIQNPEAFYHIIGATLVIFVLLNSQALQRLMTGKILVTIGALSFSIYLVHLVVLYNISSPIYLFLIPRLPYLSAVAITALISIPIVIIAAGLMYRYVDKTGIELSRKIYEKYFSGQGQLFERTIDLRSIKAGSIWIAPRVIQAAILILVLMSGAMVVNSFSSELNQVIESRHQYQVSCDRINQSYQHLVDYMNTNNETDGPHDAKTEEYRNLVGKLSVDYEDLQWSARMYEPYVNGSERQAISEKVKYYGDLVNAYQSASM